MSVMTTPIRWVWFAASSAWWGGLGGFLLPIMFGALLDRLGVSSSCFMLLYGIVSVSLALNCLTEVRRAPVMGESVAAADAT
jgi:NNP family nitrate/nitrite transporter-like MFS transporter